MNILPSEGDRWGKECSLQCHARGAALLAVTLFLLSTQTTGADGGDASVIHACLKTNGEVRIVAPADLCKSGETPVHWGIVGPQGPAGPEGSQGNPGPGLPELALHWINIHSLQPAGPSVTVSQEKNFFGMNVTSATTGGAWVRTDAPVPPGYLVGGVRLCYRLTDSRSFISQIRLAQVSDPPSVAYIGLDDAVALTDVGPACVDSRSLVSGPIHPQFGSVLLSLRNEFSNTLDQIRVIAVGLYLQRAD